MPAAAKKGKLWFPGQFFMGLMQSLLVGVRRIFISTFLRRLWWPIVGFPLYTPRGMTPKALSAILRAEQRLTPAENQVAKMEWESLETGAIGIVSRVLLSYTLPVPKVLASDTRATPTRAIIKMGGSKPSHIIMNSIADFLVKEFGIYTLLGSKTAANKSNKHDGRLADLMPDIYYIGYGSSSASLLIVMEDLGYLRSSKSRVGATVAEATMMTEVICKLHGRTWNDQDLFKSFKWPTRSRCFMYSLPLQLQKLLANPLFTEEISQEPLHSTLESLYDFDGVNKVFLKLRGFPLGSKSPSHCNPSVLCHGDLRLDNAFFDDEKKICRMIDWQICSISHPIIELAMLALELNSDIVSRDVVTALFTQYVKGVTRELRDPSLKSTVPTVDELLALLPLALFNGSIGWVLASAAASSNPEVMGPLLKAYFRRLNLLLQLFPMEKATA